MQRSYYEYPDSNYYGGDSTASIDEYLERVTRMQRMPSMVTDYPEVVLNAHKGAINNSVYPENHDGHHKKFFNVNHQHQAPEMHKKVHFVEHDKIVEVGRDGKREVHKEMTIDLEADGFIQQKHRNFDKCDTFKPY